MRGLKQILGCLLAVAVVGGTAVGMTATKASVNAAEEKQDVQLDLDKFTTTGAEIKQYANVAYMQSGTKNFSPTDKDATAFLRIGLGGVDLSSASSFRFLMKADTNAGYYNFGFIDTNGVAYWVNGKALDGQVSGTAVQYLNFGSADISSSYTSNIAYTGIPLKSGDASYVCLNKTMFTNAIGVLKTGGGVDWGLNVADALTKDKVFDWSSVDSVFVESTAVNPGTTNRFFSLDMVDAQNAVTQVLHAENLTKIERPLSAYAYNGENTAIESYTSGYELNEYSVGSRPLFADVTSANFSFKETVHRTYNVTGKSGTYWMTDGVEGRDLTGYSGFSYYVDTTDAAITAPLRIKWILKKDNTTDYISTGAGIRISDDGLVENVTSTNADANASDKDKYIHMVPAGFKGRIVIPFSSFLNNGTGIASGSSARVVLAVEPQSSIAANAVAKVVIEDARITNYDAEWTAWANAAMQSNQEKFAEVFSLLDGAYIRIAKNDYGLRFVVNTNKAATELLMAVKNEDLGYNVQIGALIAQTDNLNGQPLTADNATGRVIVGNHWAVENEKFYATLGYSQLQGKESTAFTVRGFCTVTYPNGASTTVYTSYCVDVNGDKAAESDGTLSRSAAYVAQQVDAHFNDHFGSLEAADQQYALDVIKQIYPDATTNLGA